VARDDGSPAMAFLTGGGELGALIRAADWSNSPLGPPGDWPPRLRAALRLVLKSQQPASLWWGGTLVNLYNDAYRAILGDKHPAALGRPAALVWPEIWDQFGPRAAAALTGETGTYDQSLLLIMARNGFPEETYHTFSLNPFSDDAGTARGLLCAITDDTGRIIGERQLTLLRELAAGTATARDAGEACRRAAACLAGNPHDLPFALIYLADPEQKTVTRAGAAGIAADHPAAPATIPLDGPAPWPIAEPGVIDLGSGFGDLPMGAWNRAPARAALLPITANGKPVGTLIAGLNPFRRFDGGYAGFIGQIAEQLGAAIGNAQAYDDERRRTTLMWSQISAVLENLPAGIALVDPEGRVVVTNPELMRMLGSGAVAALSTEGFQALALQQSDGTDVAAEDHPIARALAGHLIRDLDLVYLRGDGTHSWQRHSALPIRDAGGGIIAALAVLIDIDRQKRAELELRQLNEGLEHRVANEIRERMRFEEAFRQAQKMEAIGQLTGGVAHDFNNLLQVILGNLDALDRYASDEREPPRLDEIRRSAEGAMRGAERAAALTQRLLSFSRRQPLDPQPIDVNALIGGMEDLLRQTLGDTITVERALAADTWRVSTDPNQLESAILNLAVNARDAMPGGGTLTVETANCFIDKDYAAEQQDLQPGKFVMIAVTDGGSGMPADIVAKAFDPFFTTKEVGQGTGLGLSQVYGFVKQSGGHVRIDSEPGIGTIVRLYLPHLDDAPISSDVAELWDEVILVVEPDEATRAQLVEILGELGYEAAATADAQGALDRLAATPAIRAVLVDLDFGGRLDVGALALRLRQRRPDLGILIVARQAGGAAAEFGAIDKPLSYTALAARLRALFTRPGAA
jgi:PAS domain S-box-containing protein